MNKDDKEKENQRKISPAPIRLARPKTAPPKPKKVILIAQTHARPTTNTKG